MRDDFHELILGYTSGGFVCLAVSLGQKLGLLKALCELSSESQHVTPDDVAQKTNCNARYVKEWLSCLACADLIEVDEEEKFFVSDFKRPTLDDGPMIQRMNFLPLYCRVLQPLAEAFSNENPRLGLDYSFYGEFYDVYGELTKRMHKDALIPKLLPDVGQGIVAKLEGGIRCLDVGCGDGFHVQHLAKQFPKSTFIGLDLSETALAKANASRLQEGTQNTSFVLSTAAKMPEEWRNSFDFVTIFDACHDQQRPDLCVKEIHRVLKPGGVFAMVEMIGTSNVLKDKQTFGQTAAVLYGASLFHCLPVGSNSPDAMCMGTMWGRERGQKLLRDCGFEGATCQHLEYFISNVLYVAVKGE